MVSVYPSTNSYTFSNLNFQDSASLLPGAYSSNLLIGLPIYNLFPSIYFQHRSQSDPVNTQDHDTSLMKVIQWFLSPADYKPKPFYSLALLRE